MENYETMVETIKQRNQLLLKGELRPPPRGQLIVKGLPIRTYYREHVRRLKLEAVAHYGKICQCCGEVNIEFLCIDHINGGGIKHFKEQNLVGGQKFWTWLRKHDYPPGFRVLCNNCNLALGHYRYCPHKEPEKAMLRTPMAQLIMA